METIAGERHAWRFRPHYHAGDEQVLILAGRARLRTPNGFRDVCAGDAIAVPAGVVHRFEPVDARGWAFASRFIPAESSGIACATGVDLALRAIALLRQRPSLRSDVPELARACDVSAGHLSRVFRRATGTTLHNFHVLLALHRAKALLCRNTPVVEAALAAGFTDQAHLNREFVRMLGMTPDAFRKGWATAL